MMNEREKLRKFRELDDAFSQALRELDAGSAPSRGHAAKPVDRPTFEERLDSLMQEYSLSQSCVHKMLSTLMEYERIS